MAKKRTRLDTIDEIVEDTGGFKVKLPESVRGNVRVMRQLHRRVGDLMVDFGWVEVLVDEVEMQLSALSSAIVGEYVLEMVREAKASVKASAKKPAKSDTKLTTRPLSRCKH